MYLSFTDALLEADVQSILKREFPKIPFQIKETKSQIKVIIYVVPFKQRGQGKATLFMKRIIELGKMYQKDVTLTASDGYLDSEGDMSLKQLKDWYKKLGFKNTKGNNFVYEV